MEAARLIEEETGLHTYDAGTLSVVIHGRLGLTEAPTD